MRHGIAILIAVSLSPYVMRAQKPKVDSSQEDSSSSASFHATLPTEGKKHVLDGRCTVISLTSAMPPSLRDVFTKATREREFKLADPGKKFQETDVVTTHGLPLRRLVFGGSCEDRWFVHYERGGIGHSYEVLIFRTNSSGELQFEWGGSGFHRAESVGELRSAIASGKFLDNAAFYW